MAHYTFDIIKYTLITEEGETYKDFIEMMPSLTVQATNYIAATFKAEKAYPSDKYVHQLIECNYILTKNESERKMERFEIENSREFKAAQELARALNDYGWNEKRFALATTTFHQTLQQTLFRTIVEILKVYADPQRRTDLRNEASKEGAKKLMEVLEELHIPFI